MVWYDERCSEDEFFGEFFFDVMWFFFVVLEFGEKGIFRVDWSVIFVIVDLF